MSLTRVCGRGRIENLPHPLESLVLNFFNAFPNRKGDELNISGILSGATSISPQKGADAYKIVAMDVLGYMACQGKLIRDKEGWYHLPVAARAGTLAKLKNARGRVTT